MKVAAIITAAGSSSRWGEQQKKEYALLGDRPVLAWSLGPFLELEPAADILVTVPPGDSGRVEALLCPYLDTSTFRFVHGGSSRQESVRLGLEALAEVQPEIVLIHDGARPWVSRRLVERVLAGTLAWGACVPVLEASEAPKRVGPSGLILEDLRRDRTRLAQTPQGFRYQGILAAHRQAAALGGSPFVDDAEVYALFWAPVYTVAGERSNRKITYREDLGER